MMTVEKSDKKIVSIWDIICILTILVCFLFSPIQRQKAYAETKKISGTFTFKILNALTNIKLSYPGKTPVGISSWHYLLSSTDPAWNNASLFCVNVTIDPISTINPYAEGGHDYKTYGVITHPGGDQAFFESKGAWKMEKEGVSDFLTLESKGHFIKGTGKFEGIKAIWKSKGKGQYESNITGEWEIEYF
jgi:hypothetical protein